MFKMKLSLAAVSVAALLTSANAAYSGTYVGVNVGYANNIVKPKVNGSFANLVNPSLKKAKDFGSVPAGLHFGWEKTSTNGLFTAAEIGADFTGASKKSSLSIVSGLKNSKGSYKVEKGFSMDLAVKAGYAFGAFVPYARLGVIGTSWTQKANYSFNAPGSNVIGSSKKSAFKLGVAPGVGFQVKMGSHWITGVEYKYAIYGKEKLDLLAGNSISIKPRSHDVRARLSYAFCS